MRSRAEWGARLLALGLLLWTGWSWWRPRPDAAPNVTVAAAEEQLQSRSLTPRAIHLALATDAPSPIVRDWLGGLARSGSTVSWSGSPPALAMAAEPVREPGGEWQVGVVAEKAVALRDTLGLLDSVGAGGASVRLSTSPARTFTQLGVTRAHAGGGALDSLGRVLVLGEVGWESKFVIAALEEAGWRVNARLRLGGGRWVTQGGAVDWRAPALAAVVLLDTVPSAEIAALGGYLRGGGGVVLTGSALESEPLRALAPARVGARREAATTPDPNADPRLSLSRWSLTPRSDAVVSDAVGGVPLVVARRVERGRVAMVAVEESWRWRMTAEGEGMAEHRRWWSRVVGQVAATPPFRADPATREGAPVARLVSALGAPTAIAATGGGPDGRVPRYIFPMILLLLLAEWGSRRLRGSR